MVYERSTFSVKNGMWKGKDMDLGAGLPRKTLLSTPWGYNACNKPPHPSTAERDGTVYERSTFSVKHGMWISKDMDLGAGLPRIKLC